MGDEGRGIALFMRLAGLLANPFRMVERSRFRTFAARLLPGLERRPCAKSSSISCRTHRWKSVLICSSLAIPTTTKGASRRRSLSVVAEGQRRLDILP
jgi:hypothetical protein